MFINHYFLIRILSIVLFCGIFSYQSQAQDSEIVSWRDNWKLGIRAGTGALLTPVPDKYLNRTNYVNIPLQTPGILGAFSVKKSITPHFEMGYQFNYMRIQGKVAVKNIDIEVLTQAYTHTYLIQYNLKKTNEYKPLYNYFLYYILGTISLKNDPQNELPEGVIPESSEFEKKFSSNVAVLTGIGAGINYQLNNNLSLTGTFDLNRSSDALEDVYKIHKLFYHSSHSVNSYIGLTFGLSYSINFSREKKSTYFQPGTETEKQLIKSKIARKKGKSSKTNNSIWYDNKKGK